MICPRFGAVEVEVIRRAHILRQACAPVVLGAARRFADSRCRMEPSCAGVAVTFDDGPDPRFTPMVLDTLAAEGVRATFFVVGDQAARSPGLIRRISAEGHAVGTHSASHIHPSELGLRSLYREYRGGRQTVEDIVGTSVPLFRPPHGHISLQSAAAIRLNQLEVWLWTLDPGDWRGGITPGDIMGVTSAVSPGDVILLHDGIRQPPTADAEDRSATVTALGSIVQQVRSRGLSFLTLPTRASRNVPDGSQPAKIS